MAVTKAELIQTLAVFKELLDEDNAAKFVAQEDGKGLSTNDFTNALKEKLDEITDEVNYVGDGSNFLVAQLGDDGWTSHGTPTFAENILTLDGSSWLSRGGVTLGGADFQISGKVYESAENMIARRKIFELYTSQDLNISLYSSGAGKNLDLLVKCGGMFDNYNEPAIIGEEYTFALKYRQSTRRMRLYVNGSEVYSFEVSSFAAAQSFEQVALGAGISHDNANWLGTISGFKIYAGYAEA